MSAGSSYGKLNVETNAHTLTIGAIGVGERGQKILDNMDKILFINGQMAKREAQRSADDRWLKSCNRSLAGCLDSMRQHLRMLGADTTTIAEIIAYAKNKDVNNVRYSVLKLLAKLNPELYNRQCAQYKNIVEKQRG